MSKLIPTGKILLFHSFPDYTDNSYALYRYLINSEYQSKYLYVWLVSNKSLFKKIKRKILKDRRDVKVYRKNSVLGLYYFYRAKYVFCTHGLHSYIKLCQTDKIINLWHGMPLKRIGHLDQKSNTNPFAHRTIATSTAFQKIMAESFNLDTSDVWVVGQPRNDMLFEPTNFYLTFKINLSKFKKKGIWLPTYRKSIVGALRTDGIFTEGNISFLSPAELLVLDRFLSKNGILLIIKIHPMDYLQNYHFPDFKNILIIQKTDVAVQLYPLLGSTDFLLTDYSSVWVDYQILGRPIGFVMDDYSEYEASRGFCFDNIKELLPGPILSTFDSLKDFLMNTNQISHTSCTILNKYRDNKSSERLIKQLNL